jgi:hypothetical protein
VSDEPANRRLLGRVGGVVADMATLGRQLDVGDPDALAARVALLEAEALLADAAAILRGLDSALLGVGE